MHEQVLHAVETPCSYLGSWPGPMATTSPPRHLSLACSRIEFKGSDFAASLTSSKLNLIFLVCDPAFLFTVSDFIITKTAGLEIPNCFAISVGFLATSKSAHGQKLVGHVQMAFSGLPEHLRSSSLLRFGLCFIIWPENFYHIHTTMSYLAKKRSFFAAPGILLISLTLMLIVFCFLNRSLCFLRKPLGRFS